MGRPPRPEDNVFPGWNKRKANALLKRGAVELNFPVYELAAGYSWHCYRHGKAEVNVHRLGLSEVERCQRARWRSIKAETSYVGNRLLSEKDNALMAEVMRSLASAPTSASN
jgi:hypothetical protein